MPLVPSLLRRSFPALRGLGATVLMTLPAAVSAQPTVPTAARGAATAAQATTAPKRPLTMEDLLSWRGIRTPALSNDGRWMAYVLAPNEGDAEFVVRGTAAGATETRVAIGEPAAGFGGASGVAISGNNRWVAYTVYPTAEEARKARRDRKTPVTKVGVIDLTTGAKREFERARSFRFAGDRSDVLAVQLMPPDAPAGGNGAPAVSGSTVLLVDLTGGAPVTLVGVGEFAFDAAGRYLAWTVDQRDQLGNGVQLRELSTGVVRALDGAKAQYRRLAWADTGDALAVIRSVADSAARDTASTILGWARLTSRTPVTLSIDDQSAGMPAGLMVSADRMPKWSDAQGTIYFGLREPRPAPPASTAPPVGGGASAPAPGAGAGGQIAPARQDEDTPSLILWHWKDPRLQSAQQVTEAQDRSFSYLAAWHIATPKVVRLSDATVRDVVIADGDRWALGADFTPYERQASVDGRALRDLYAIDATTGERTLIAKGLQNPGGPYRSLLAPDGQRAAWYDDGHWHVHEFATRQSRRVTEGVAATFWDDEDDHNVVKPPVAPPFGWSRDSRQLFVRDNWDLWRVGVAGGPALNVTGNGKAQGIRYQMRVGADPKEKGIDLTKPLFVETYGERTKREGLMQVDAQRGGTRVLAWEDAKVDFRRARDAEIWAFTRQTFVRFPDWYVADAGLANERRLTDANPQQAEVAWSAGARLIDYTCENSDTPMQGALFLPAGYEEGKRYPTLTYIYELLSQGLHAYAQPNATRYANPSVYTSRGYAYFMPDIRYQLDEPGRSAVWCVVPAVKAAIAAGIVDSTNVALQGHSWGGYQTSFITTQTNLFKTAIAGAPLTDMVSMFSSVYWNSGNTNQGIFISSQGRFRSSYARNPDAYLRNSPNRFAQNVNIPFMILHNDRDGAVDFNQGITHYNTLRELGKEVVLLEYVGENHGLARPANQKDYAMRMQEWFDHFLQGKPAPQWMQEGVPRLRMEEHLRERRPLVDPKVAPKKPIAM
ncbi:MAG: prolyl oligopeptidase family serine peptidase [Gemmatimonadota bacterium]|nr:prolyl oligopeptidase family serine peptidase [Gemmatimonadota bacterium]MDQ8146524.1 prolyl oligopeptidase family serine peptidase [Gemmatimonadota bacterium]MDQ8148449.1 prolyl oligopeptidase family serine peptidase [Gemmatimonadota bacterium]MDQ8156643.1 prolyl oligopeptidase family serine peptidase [Gemmatimonadota bacterium]MDQ8175878.1 prolyl oligopeptidase family serine peptidase [Gemmatimonadota bacterium]